jgi:hypothetical protein
MAAFPSPPTAGIHDALVTPLRTDEGGRLSILAFEDHLLRRFGRAEIVRLAPGGAYQVLRVKADEVWTLVEGAAELRMEDTRAVSPTSGVSQTAVFDSPTRFLLPFGVRLRIRAVSASLLLRLMTHSETEDTPGPENG